MVKKRKRRFRREEPLAIRQEIFAFLERMGGSRERGRLYDLCQNWAQIMGDEIASQTLEVQGKEKNLILRVADSMSMQELSFQKEEILEKANKFLGSRHFEKISLVI